MFKIHFKKEHVVFVDKSVHVGLTQVFILLVFYQISTLIGAGIL